MTSEDKERIVAEAMGMAGSWTVFNAEAKTMLINVVNKAVELTEKELFTPLVARMNGEHNSPQWLIDRLASMHPCEGRALTDPTDEHRCLWCDPLAELEEVLAKLARQAKEQNK